MKKFNKIGIISVLILSMLFVATGCSSSKKGDTIRIVHKNYTEQRLMGQMMSVYLESKGYKTEVSELGGSMLCFNALNNGDADMYPEYTGTGYCLILKQTDIMSAEETYDYVKERFEKEYGITWLKSFGFNDTYVLSVTEETKNKYNLNTISDLIPIAGDMVIGSDSEFGNRADGLPGMIKTYEGLEFKELKSMDQGLTYQALVDGELDVNVSYATDGRIAKYGLKNLEDDKGFFPPYYVMPIMKMDYAKNNPEVVKELEALENQWSNEDMQNYNLMVDEGSDPKEVATLMLRDKGLID